MLGQVPSIVAAYITLAGLYLAGVLLLFDPVSARDVGVHLLPLPLAFVVAIAVYIALFVWFERVVVIRSKRPWRLSCRKWPW